MVLIALTINVVSCFMLFAVGIIPGLNLVGVPFLFLGIFTIKYDYVLYAHLASTSSVLSHFPDL